MKPLSRLAALVFTALAVAAFALALWLDARGELAPGPVDAVWIDAAPEAAPVGKLWQTLGLAAGDRLRVAQKSASHWEVSVFFSPTDTPAILKMASLESLLADVWPKARPIWICRADRDLADLPSAPRGASLAILPAISEVPEGFELLGMELVTMPRAGRPFTLRFSLGSLRGATGRVRLRLDDEAAGEIPVSVFSSPVSFEFALTAARSGTHGLALEALDGLAPGRPRELHASFEVLEAPGIRSLGEASEVSSWLERQGFVQREGEADLWILSRPLAGDEAAMLENAVREGAGLLVLGGESWQPGSAASLPTWLPGTLRALPASPHAPSAQIPGKSPDLGPSTIPAPTQDPVKNDMPQPVRETRESGVLALMLVFDKSGSMAGEKLEKTIEAAVATAKTLDAKDWLGVLAFDREVKEILPLGPVSQGGDLAKRLESVDAGGGTRIFPALSRGAQLLSAAPASIRHLILLTDGATEDKVAKDAPYFEFVQEQARAGLTLTTVGIRGGDYDSEFLSNLAYWGKGRFYPVDADRVPQIFTLEARRVRAGPANSTPSPEAASSEWFVRSKDAHPALTGIDWELPKMAPPLRGIRELAPHPWAAIPLQADKRPLLAISHVGAGKVAVWGSWGSGTPIADWMGDARARQFWVQLAEFLRRPDLRPSPLLLQAPGADLERRLLDREERMRELARMSVRCRGNLTELADLPKTISRDSLPHTPQPLPWIALTGALFSLLGIAALLRESSFHE